jgi:light-regulated signal transduction histidine kinase (bacteriophytochrome)
LYICKEIINRHKGKLWVESTPGEGSTFFFELQLAK